MDTYFFFNIVLYILGSILLIVLIFLGIKLIMTLDKVDKLVNEITDKTKQLDSTFSIINKISDALSGVNDKLLSVLTGCITGLITKIKNKKERNDFDE